MALSWFLVGYIGYKRVGLDPDDSPSIMRYCAMEDFTALIQADGGRWTETEILGDRAIVKVRATPATLTMIAGTPGFRRLPKDKLDDPLSSLSTAAKTKLRDELIDAGYTLAEFQSAHPGGVGSITLRQLLKFLARRRRKPRYDEPTDSIIFDGPMRTPRVIESVDAEVQ